jgi:hypothetical protein
MTRGMFIGVFSILFLLGIAALHFMEPHFAYIPPDYKTVNPLVQTIRTQSLELLGTEEQAELGKASFSADTFGNEVFFTDIMGLFDGPVTLPAIAKAVVQLRGEGTTNLQVAAARTVTVGGRRIERGEMIETGLDVPKGAYMPLGVKVSYANGRMKAGVTCLACHAVVDPATKQVVMGVPNTDLNVGPLLAMATNTTSYIAHSNIDVSTLKQYVKDVTREVPLTDRTKTALPDIAALEDAIDREFMKWPKGGNDTTIDFKSNPVQIPDSFTMGDHPYGWSGQGGIGPFKGLTAAINNAHAQNMDALSQSELSSPVMGIDKELFLGILLQNAFSKKYRYVPNTKVKPSEFFARVDPTPGTPGVNHLVPTPGYPKSSYMSAVGMFNSEPGFLAWEQALAMSAFMNRLTPPKDPSPRVEAVMEQGQEIFRRAQCISCHARPVYSGNRVIPVRDIGTEPSRAAGFGATQQWFASPSYWEPNTKVPVPTNATSIGVSMTEEESEQMKLAWAHTGEGGYKIPSLVALRWSAPYLHDGGVAVGPSMENDLGLPGTWSRGIPPDPANSLRALIDRDLRQKVMSANQAGGLAEVHVTGQGHSYWVDEAAGFTREQQNALIQYLLSLR